MIRTIIVDDEILSRIGIQSFIDGKEDIVVAGTFGDAQEAVTFLHENLVDIVITDIEMSELNGLDFIKIIRKEKLAGGVIILSCHDDFSYAQEAIASGTDSYMLKHNVTEEKLIAEIKKVYEKLQNSNPQNNIRSVIQSSSSEKQEELYAIGMLQIDPVYENIGEHSEKNTEDVMLIHLLEGILERNKMGTVFSPYGKNLFIVFRFAKENSLAERQEALSNYITIIKKNVKQYINGHIVFGISTYFEDLRQMRKKYEEAASALQISFYNPEEECFYYKERKSEWTMPEFTTDDFIKECGLNKFRQELDLVLSRGGFHEVEVNQFKENLIQAVLKMMYQVIKINVADEQLANKWNIEVEVISVIHMAQNRDVLMQNVMSIMGSFQTELKKILEKDELVAAFAYIEKHLAENISLTEMAEMSCMSVPTFCKKIKEKTGLTLVQYMNERRIEKAKRLLIKKENTLEMVAEQTGFSNANYLVRVFKKVTGQTVSEYRKQYNIFE